VPKLMQPSINVLNPFEAFEKEAYEQATSKSY
jgi:hypothetical protein